MRSYTDGESFFESVWGDARIKCHSECVIDACLRISARTTLNQDIFIIAGWIHDLGRKISKDTHQRRSLEFLHTFLQKHPEYLPYRREIEDCVLNHRTDGTPTTIYGQVFKCADKLALHDVRWKAYCAQTKSSKSPTPRHQHDAPATRLARTELQPVRPGRPRRHAQR